MIFKDGVGMRGLRNVVLVLGVALVVGLAAAGQALATPPTHETLPPEADPGFIDCGSFQDNFVDFFSGAQTTFYDSNGDPVRIVQHIEHHSNDVNSVTGLTLHEHGHYTATVDLVAETYTITGNQEVASLPGKGVVVQDVGRQVFDFNGSLVFFAGGRKHSELFEDGQLFCDALG